MKKRFEDSVAAGVFTMYKQTFLTQDKTNRRQRDKGLFGEKKKKEKKKE